MILYIDIFGLWLTLVRIILVSLSSYSIPVPSSSATLNLLKNLYIHMFSFATCSKAMYLALIVEVDIIYCYLLYQDIKALYR